MHRNRFRRAPDSLGELTALPRTPSCNKGDLLLREGRHTEKGKWRRGREKEGSERMERQGRVRKGGERGDSPYQS